MSTNSNLIAVTEIVGQLDKTKTIEQNTLIAFKAAQNHWLIGLSYMEKDQWESATVALAELYGKDSEEYERLKQECKFINATQFTPSNVPVDFKGLIDGMDEDIKPIGLMKIWEESKK